MKTFSIIFIAFLLLPITIFAQEKDRDVKSVFTSALIRFDEGSSSPYEIRFIENSGLTELNFFEIYKKHFGLSGDYDFELIQETKDQLGQIHYRYSEYYKGIEIIGAQYILHKKDGYIHYANGHIVHNLNLNVSPSYSEESALQLALNHIGAKSYMWENESNENFLKKEKQDPNATYFPDGHLKLTSGTQQLKESNVRLVYRFDIYAEYPLSRNYVDVDAITGKVVNVISRIMEEDVPGSGESLYNGLLLFTADEVVPGSSYRLQEHTTRTAAIESFDMQGGSVYTNAVDFLSSTANGPWDSAGVNAHFGAEATFDYYLNDHGRNGLDDAGFPMRSYIHANLVGLGFENNINAFWDGSKVTYGDGDGINYFPLVSLDVISHEFTHGVTEFSANLIYQAESGALNESFSDIFGNLVEFMIEGNPGSGSGSWRMGEDFCLTGLGFRNMANPNELGHPDTYFGNFWAPLDGGDNGGVHTNSGVQNYWFYLLSEGGSGVNDNGYNYNITGIGLTDAAKIAYRNLTVYLVPSSKYEDARLATINSAIDLFGNTSQQFYSILEAWNAVGVYYPAYQQTIGVSSDTLLLMAEFPQSKYVSDFQIINLGLNPLTIDSIFTSGNDFEVIECPALPYSLNDYEDTLTIGIQFTANSQGNVTEVLNILSNDPNNPIKSVVLNGYGYIINTVQDTTFYACNGAESGGLLLMLNKFNGTATEVDTTNYLIINSMSVNPTTRKLYGMITNYTQSSVLKINATEADAYSILTIELPQMTIAFDTSGNLYGALRTGEIYLIDLENNSLNLIATPSITLSAIAFNPFTNEMWAAPYYPIGPNKDKIYKINLLNGEASEIGLTGFNAIINDLAFDEHGKLYGIIGRPTEMGKFVSVDTSNAQGSIIGETGFINVPGLAYSTYIVVSVDDENNSLPEQFSLEQNYPNPFNSSTKIRYQIPELSFVAIKIYDVLGNEITTLVNQEKPIGNYEVEFDADALSSGIYFYRLKAGNFVQTKKMILMK